jgi:secreted Zn-dependent insulinase-like peptidase
MGFKSIMESEIISLQNQVAAAGFEFNLAINDAFRTLTEQGPNAKVHELIEHCFSMAREYETCLNNLLGVLNLEPAKYAEEITRVYKHKVLKTQGLDSLAFMLERRSENTL